MIIDNHTHIRKPEHFETYAKKIGTKDFTFLILDYFDDFPPLDELIKLAADTGHGRVVAMVDMDKDIAAQLLKLRPYFEQKKIVGIKLYPGYQHFYPGDSRVEPIAKLCLEFDKPLIFHNGDVYDPKHIAKLKFSHPIHVDELAGKFPQCKIVISHFGFPYLLETANVVSKNDNVYTDISGTIDEVGSAKEIEALRREYVRDLQHVLSYFPNVKNKMMLGTDYSGEDCPLNQVQPYLKVIDDLLTKDQKQNALFQLAQKLYLTE